MLFRKVTICAAMVLAYVCASGAARADLTVVQQSSTKGDIAFFKPESIAKVLPETTITYYKKNKQRTETDGTVEIYDGATNVTYTLHPDTKTYTEAKGFLSRLITKAPGILTQTHLDGKTVVEAGDKTRTIAGQKTRNYNVITVFTFRAANPTVSGKAISDEDGEPSPILPLTITVQSERWAAESLHSGLDGSQAIAQEWKCLPAALPTAGTAIKDFASQMGKIKGMTLNSTDTMTFGLPTAFVMAANALGEKLPSAITTVEETKSVSHARLDDALFVVPADYKKVDYVQAVTPKVAKAN